VRIIGTEGLERGERREKREERREESNRELPLWCLSATLYSLGHTGQISVLLSISGIQRCAYV
jgi:hypothetical protein